MPFVSDAQRKAVFAKLGGRRRFTTGPSKPPKPPKPPKAPAPIPDQNGYMPGPSPAPSNWFVADPQPNNYPNPYGGTGGNVFGQYDQTFSLTPQQAQQLYQQNTGIWTQLFNILVNGIDPNSTQPILPFGTPGTLIPFYEATFGAYETWNPANDDLFGQVAGPTGTTGVNPFFLNNH